MLEMGYAGVSSRKVAAQADLKSNLLHYYFRTMDDLFIAVFRRMETLYFAGLEEAAASERPLHALWALYLDAASSRLILEFNALACHRPAVREVLAQSAVADRQATIELLSSVFDRYGLDPSAPPAGVVATTIAALARSTAIERSLGIEVDRQALGYFTDLLERLEP